ncbi:MAG: glutamate 5-kinase [Clostridia bacterium]|nr:glutamate 5-kinase [Clostridia bacterium]
MKRLVLKIGSSSLFSGNDFAEKEIEVLARQIKKIRDEGVEVCLITSGAIAIGMQSLGLSKKPTELPLKQALAAIGQMYLMERYEKIFEKVSVKPAQILLSHDDFGNRDRVKNLNNTISALFSYGVIPVINENDALATEEIKVGDNDTLAAMIALNVGADMLVIISDVDGLYDKNPAENEDAKLISTVEKVDKTVFSLAKAPSSKVGTGGMITKLKAAKICGNSGISMMIVGNGKIGELSKVLNGENLGTLFMPSGKMPVRKNWLLSCANVSGKIFVDEGAKTALLNRKSLLSCGVTELKGTFASGSVVEIAGVNGEVFAKGIVAFGSDTLKTLDNKGEHHSQLIIHANNIVLKEEL